MPNLNKVMIMGNLTRDPELKHTPSNQAVVNLGIAVNRSYSTRDGESREETTFVDCEAWGKTAEIMAKYLSKGRPVFVEGRLKLDTWQDRDGNNRSKLRVVVENFQFLGGRGEGGQGGGGGGDARSGHEDTNDYGSSAPSGDGGGGGHQGLSEDDIPF